MAGYAANRGSRALAGAATAGETRGMAIDDILVDLADLRGDPVPAEPLNRIGGGSSEVTTQVVVLEQRLHALGERLRTTPRDQIARLSVVHRVLQPADAGRDHRRTGSERLDGDQPEALIVGRHDADVGRLVVVRQFVARDRSDEAHAIADPQLVGQCFKLGDGVRRRLAVSARDDQRDRSVEFRRGHGSDQDVHTLERLQPAHEQGNRAVVQAELRAGRCLVAGLEAGQIDAGGYHRDTIALRTIELDQEVALMGSRADEAIGRSDDSSFCFDSGGRLLLGSPGAVLDLAQGMKHGDVRHMPSIGQAKGNQA